MKKWSNVPQIPNLEKYVVYFTIRPLVAILKGHTLFLRVKYLKNLS